MVRLLVRLLAERAVQLMRQGLSMSVRSSVGSVNRVRSWNFCLRTEMIAMLLLMRESRVRMMGERGRTVRVCLSQAGSRWDRWVDDDWRTE